MAQELLISEGYEKPKTKLKDKNWELIFHPKQFVLDNPGMKLDDFRLNEQEYI